MTGSETIPPKVETSNDLIEWIILSSEEIGIYLTVHPERWSMNESEWAYVYPRSLHEYWKDRDPRFNRWVH